MRHPILACILTVVMTAVPVLASIRAIAQERGLPASLEQTIEHLRADLNARGYDVAQGYWKLFTIQDCTFAIASMGNCLGNNPSAPYVFPSVPLWRDEYVDRDMKEAFGPLPHDTWATFRLDEREALVILAQLPPPGKYFGLQTYVYSREGSVNRADPVYRGLAEIEMRNLLFARSPNPSRVLLFSSMGNSNNNFTIEQQSGSSFNQQRFFIITPDQVMEREMTSALLRTGIADGNQVFIEPVSAPPVRLGLGSEADDFMILVRYAMPVNEIAGGRWRERLPLAVLRVRDRNMSRATEPYPAPAYDRKISRSELSLEKQFFELVRAVKLRWGAAAATDHPFLSLQLAVDLVGQHCMQRRMNCLADTQDTDYQVSPSLGLDSGEIIAVVGTLGTATGNATYVSLSVNRVAVLTGVANVSDADLEGSASGFASTVENTDQFYVYYFARDCNGLSHCLQVSEEMVPKGEAIKVIQRNYVVPGTARGADPKGLLNPSVVVFKEEHMHLRR